MTWKALVVATWLATWLIPAAAFAQQPGVLLLAHGGSPQWNERVVTLAAELDRSRPVEVAFGMATKRTIQEAVDRLNARQVSEIVAVPLFVSSWSSVVTASEYLLGLRAEAPPELAMFARMDHGQPSNGTADHSAHAISDGSTPVVSKAPIVAMTSALNDHRLVAEILTSRAQAISRIPAAEAVVIVAHGPVTDSENEHWLADMGRLAAQVAAASDFASIDYLTVRDDAPKPVRDAAAQELRAVVARRTDEGRRVLIVPLLLSFGGIERGIVERLNGLPFSMTDAGLMPDEKIGQWVEEMSRRPQR